MAKKTTMQLVEKPCWYEICRVQAPEYDDEILPIIGDDDSREGLAPSCAKLDELIEYLSKTYDDGMDGPRTPIPHQPDLLRENYCPAPRDRLVAIDERERVCVMWRKGTYKTTQEVPVEDPVDKDEAKDGKKRGRGKR